MITDSAKVLSMVRTIDGKVVHSTKPEDLLVASAIFNEKGDFIICAPWANGVEL